MSQSQLGQFVARSSLSGQTLSYDDETLSFLCAGGKRLTIEEVERRDKRGEIEWAYPSLREWADKLLEWQQGHGPGREEHGPAVPNEVLQHLCAYWLDCVKSENVLEKDISVAVRKKATINPFAFDPFIFGNHTEGIDAASLADFAQYVADNRWETYYGYPLLLYLDDDGARHLVAPLFLVQVIFDQSGEGLRLICEDSYPSCGTQAFYRLGMRTEEIADLSQAIESLFSNPSRPDGAQLVATVLSLREEEASVVFQETVNPEALSEEKLSRTAPVGVYNMGLLLAGDPSAYNVHLLRDLTQLKTRSDLASTALSVLATGAQDDPAVDLLTGTSITPVLPFPADYFQMAAIARSSASKLTVVTGPPGTGKSQFICNLLATLFVSGASVLFVSHTNEAVEVVDRKLNEAFPNLLLRTGHKALRQDLRGKFSKLSERARRRHKTPVDIGNLTQQWHLLTLWRERILRRDELEDSLEQAWTRLRALCEELEIQHSLLGRLRLRLVIWRQKRLVRRLKNDLGRLPSKGECEKRVVELEDQYVLACREFLRTTYAQTMLGRGSQYGSADSFIAQVSASYLREGAPTAWSCRNALRCLPLWSCTLKSVGRSFPLESGLFDYVVFDEASQVDIPSAAPALYRAKAAIVVGDPMQLTHIASITRDVDRGLARHHELHRWPGLYPERSRYCDVSLYRAAADCLDELPLLLSNHYRSHDSIIALCNNVFYQGKLRPRSELDMDHIPDLLPLGVTWVDCEGEVLKHPSGSRVNQEEVEKVVATVRWVLRCIGKTQLTLGVVTPYSRQREAIYQGMQASVKNFDRVQERHQVQVLTAHKFQGSEKDIMVFSTVLAERGNGNSDRWYDIYPQILNVALSRARYSLFVVGDYKFCKSRLGTLGKVVAGYEALKGRENLEKSYYDGKFDSPTELAFFQSLQNADLADLGYEVKPKLVVKRYTLDFALVGPTKVDVELDGCQHEIVGGLPVVDDLVRDAFLVREGWRVIRIPNHKVRSEGDQVISEIIESLKSQCSPSGITAGT